MLLTITTTRAPAADLGYLLHKNPARPQPFDLPFGTAHVFHPDATAGRRVASAVGQAVLGLGTRLVTLAATYGVGIVAVACGGFH